MKSCRNRIFGRLMDKKGFGMSKPIKRPVVSQIHIGKGLDGHGIRAAVVRAVTFLLFVAVALAALPQAAYCAISPEEISGLVDTQTDASLITNPLIDAAAAARESVLGVHNYQVVTGSLFGIPLDLGFTLPSSGEELVGAGSGVVVSPYGHVLTNYHVVENASRTTVQQGSREVPAMVVGADPGLDIAVLLAPTLGLPAAPLGDSDELKIGEWAIVIGNPLGQDLERSVTVGVVSALDRRVSGGLFGTFLGGAALYNRMIQVDAAINQGNSGGGMFNVLGQLQGIPSMKFSSSSFFTSASIDNIGMCIPINAAKPLLRSVLERYDEDLLKVSQAAETPRPRPRLGVTAASLAPDFKLVAEGKVPPGAYVQEVEKGSAAQAADIRVGDIITGLGDREIRSSSELVKAISALEVGDKVSVQIFRLEGFREVLEGMRSAGSLGQGESLVLQVEL